MRARAGDPPRTMPQKILAGRCADPQLRGDLVEVKVDQVILTRSPNRALAEALALGLKKTPVELAIAYDGFCVTDERTSAAAQQRSPEAVAPEITQSGILLARAGIGFPAVVHLERFASPARLAVTDDPRLCAVGGTGMLSIVVPPGQLGQALALGTVWLRPPRSAQILLSGRVRPFVCARDVALELLRRGLLDVVKKIEAEHHAPVVLEFGGPSARLLSVSERAALCAIAPQAGAVGALFVSDEKTEVFLRDQRRSKAHRSLSPDPGAPCDDVMSIDLGAVDPLVLDEAGIVRPVRDLAGKPVSQVILGGDSGTTLRDLLAAATLLKSKRVPGKLDFIVAPPSRQILEVLGQSGALVDLIATGARIIEPDRRVTTGELYPPPAAHLSLRTSDPEPRKGAGFVVASAETIAYAVATGNVGDPRTFKRPVRVTVPRALPTDDVLVYREKRSEAGSAKKGAPLLALSAASPNKGEVTLELLHAVPTPAQEPKGEYAVVLATLDELRLVTARIPELLRLRAVLAPYIPSGMSGLFAGNGILPLRIESPLAELKSETRLTLGVLPSEGDDVMASAGALRLNLKWTAIALERNWTSQGHARPHLPAARPRSA